MVEQFIPIVFAMADNAANTYWGYKKGDRNECARFGIADAFAVAYFHPEWMRAVYEGYIREQIERTNGNQSAEEVWALEQHDADGIVQRWPIPLQPTGPAPAAVEATGETQ